MKRFLAQGGLTGFTGHNLRDTFATLVDWKARNLTVSTALIRDRIPGVASRYVTRNLPSLLESYSPLRQIEGELSPGLTDGGLSLTRRCWHRRYLTLDVTAVKPEAFLDLIPIARSWECVFPVLRVRSDMAHPVEVLFWEVG